MHLPDISHSVERYHSVERLDPARVAVPFHNQIRPLAIHKAGEWQIHLVKQKSESLELQDAECLM